MFNMHVVYTGKKAVCPVCQNEQIERGQNYCDICGCRLEWKDDSFKDELKTDRFIGEKMGKHLEFDGIYWTRDENGDYILWRPTRNMSDAWEVGEYFGLTGMTRYPGNEWGAWFGSIVGIDESASKAICAGAIKKVKNDMGIDQRELSNQ